jgi:hypothetical protein
MFGGPAHCGERLRRTARRHRHQPIAAIRRRPEHCRRAAECAKGRPRILRSGIRNIATDDGHPAAGKAPERAMHPRAEIAVSLRYPVHPHRQAEPCMVRCDRQHGAEPPVGVVTWKRSAARSPISRASRRFTAPSRGARANTTTVSLIRTAARSAAAVRRRNTASGRRGCAASGGTSLPAATSPPR